MTVAQAFEQMMTTLHLTDAQKARAEKQRQVIVERLRTRISIAEDFISGSFGRNTATSPISDVDIVIILNRDQIGDADPSGVLEQVQAALDAAYPNKEHPILQNRSVGISFSGTGIDFDVVPAFKHAGILQIPDRETNRWIPTDPKLHKDLCNKANDDANKKLKPLVKAAKQWNGALPEKVVRSFHLEVMAYTLLKGAQGGYAEALAGLFAGLVEQVRYSCPEPAGLGDPLDSDMTPADRDRAAKAFADAADQAKRAIEFASAGQTAYAHWLWRELLGPVYPERGKQPPKPTGAIKAGALAARAVDPSSVRFG